MKRQLLHRKRRGDGGGNSSDDGATGGSEDESMFRISSPAAVSPGKISNSNSNGNQSMSAARTILSNGPAYLDASNMQQQQQQQQQHMRDAIGHTNPATSASAVFSPAAAAGHVPMTKSFAGDVAAVAAAMAPGAAFGGAHQSIAALGQTAAARHSAILDELVLNEAAARNAAVLSHAMVGNSSNIAAINHKKRLYGIDMFATNDDQQLSSIIDQDLYNRQAKRPHLQTGGAFQNQSFPNDINGNISSNGNPLELLDTLPTGAVPSSSGVSNPYLPSSAADRARMLLLQQQQQQQQQMNTVPSHPMSAVHQTSILSTPAFALMMARQQPISSEPAANGGFGCLFSGCGGTSAGNGGGGGGAVPNLFSACLNPFALLNQQQHQFPQQVQPRQVHPHRAINLHRNIASDTNAHVQNRQNSFRTISTAAETTMTAATAKTAGSATVQHAEVQSKRSADRNQRSATDSSQKRNGTARRNEQQQQVQSKKIAKKGKPPKHDGGGKDSNSNSSNITDKKQGFASMVMGLLMQQEQQKDQIQQAQKPRTVEDAYLAGELQRLSLSEQQEVAQDLQPEVMVSSSLDAVSVTTNGSSPSHVVTDNATMMAESAPTSAPTSASPSTAPIHGAFSPNTTASNGVDPFQDPPEERPENLKALFEQMDQEMLKLRKQKEWYDKAAFLSPWYVRDEKFRLAFLRADRYNPKKAAARLALHFQIKAKLFCEPFPMSVQQPTSDGQSIVSERGPVMSLQLLAKPITWDDLDQEAQDCFLSAHAFFSPCLRDRAGRGIFYCNNSIWDTSKFSPKSYLRAYWYAIMTMLWDDDETQKRGMIGVVYAIGGSLSTTISLGKVLSEGQFDRSMPVRGAAIYLCLDHMNSSAASKINTYENDASTTPMVSFFTKLFRQSMTQALRLRVRTFFGSFLECNYQLATAGIPIDKMPFTDQGDLDFVKFSGLVKANRAMENEYMERDRLKILEEEERLLRMEDGLGEDEGKANDNKGSTSSSSSKQKEIKSRKLIVIPSKYCVLTGRGRPFQSFSGNVHLFEHIAACKDAHGALDKQRREKTDLSKRIVRLVQDKGGKFLKRVGPGWMEVNDDLARTKVSMGFRNINRRNKG